MHVLNTNYDIFIDKRGEDSSSSSCDVSKVSTPTRGVGSMAATPNRTTRLTGTYSGSKY